MRSIIILSMWKHSMRRLRPIFIFAATTVATANATSDSCNSEGCNGDYTCINPNQPLGAKGCPNDPKCQ